LKDTCPFCNIVSGKAPASIVYENENVLAFMDLNPASVGHMLVIPKGHWENIYEIPEKYLFEVSGIVKRVCIAVKKTVGADGIKVIQLNGRAAGQAVMHIHFHVIPIMFASGKMMRTHGRIRSQRNELDEIAKKIQKNL
jgi:diadenosine tetraphosphate (Ap4A) HIT family hydrolase